MARGNAGPTLPAFPRQRDSRAIAQARLRDLIRRGELGGLSETERNLLRPAAYDLAHHIVYDVVTRRVARNRGHHACARGLRHMEESCLDGFHADLDAVVDHLLRLTRPIADPEVWLVRRALHASIDGHRRRRSETNALQRPRMTKMLARGLGDDPWLHELAVKILTWVGLPAGVGATMWPLNRWAGDRADCTGDHRGSTEAQVRIDVDRVLDVMRRQPVWFGRYVEDPLGRKIAPVGGSPGESAGEPRPLLPTGADEIDEVRIGDLATVALEAIGAGLRRGQDPAATVVEVLTVLFLDGTGADEIDRPPGGGSGRDDRLSALLDDPAAVSELAEQVLRIVHGPAD